MRHECRVENRAVYVASGIDLDGRKGDGAGPKTSMSLPLVTARAVQSLKFHGDTGTLEIRSNVAGTGKAETRVIAAFGSGLKEFGQMKMRCRKWSFSAEFTNLEERIPPFDYPEVRNGAIDQQGASKSVKMPGRV